MIVNGVMFMGVLQIKSFQNTSFRKQIYSLLPCLILKDVYEDANSLITSLCDIKRCLLLASNNNC